MIFCQISSGCAGKHVYIILQPKNLGFSKVMGVVPNHPFFWIVFPRDEDHPAELGSPDAPSLLLLAIAAIRWQKPDAFRRNLFNLLRESSLDVYVNVYTCRHVCSHSVYNNTCIYIYIHIHKTTKGSTKRELI